MSHVLKKFILIAFLTLLTSQANAMWIQPDWFEVDRQSVGTNRYAYCGNDPINCTDRNGNIPDNWATEDYSTAYDSSGYTHTYDPVTGGNTSVYDSRTDTSSGSIRSTVGYGGNAFSEGEDGGSHTIGVYAPSHGIDLTFRDHVNSSYYDSSTQYRRQELETAVISGSQNMADARAVAGGLLAAGSFATGAGQAVAILRGGLYGARTLSTTIPNGWVGKANRKGVGSRWSDPANPGNGIRIDRGNPGHSLSSQRVDHVVVRRNGQIIGRDGRPISGPIRKNATQAHIPLSEYKGWSSWFKP